MATAFVSDDEVGQDLALVDWDATPLGPPERWPASLQAAVNILLSSRFSMWMAWGPDLTFFCNAAYRRDTLGRKYPWALGRPAREVWAEIWNDIGPRIDAVLSTGKATWDEALLLFLERSGYVEETYHTFSYSPLRDDAGQVVGMLCVVREDTDRIIAERRMATLRDLGSDPNVVRSEAENLRFAEGQLAGNQWDLPFTLIYLLDEDGQRLAATSGITAGDPAAPERIRRGEHDAIWPFEKMDPSKSLRIEPATAELPRGEWPEPPTQALIVPLAQQGGMHYGFFVSGLNRYRPLDESYYGFVELVARQLSAGIAGARSYQTQLRRAEELAELDRAKTAFFSNVSHEFRTPLTLIMGPLQELRSGTTALEPAVRDDLDVIHRNALRLSKLVNTLLDFSRIEAGRLGARYEPIDLAKATADLASVFRSAIERAGLVFTVDCPPLAEAVFVDLGMWEKVVLNLLSNALKYTRTGSIGISVRAEDSEVVVTVADTGVGVPATEMPRLFERFHRVENTWSRSNEGSGIGLALVQELVSLHGGSISAASVEGEGTAFTIRLPVGSAHLPPGAVSTAAHTPSISEVADPYVQEALRWLPDEDQSALPWLNSGPSEDWPVGPAAGSGKPARVLVADDNADMRGYLARILTGGGHEVTTAEDGEEALRVIRTQVPDLVVADVMMPRLDGLALVASVRAEPRIAEVPILLLSARAGSEASVEGLHAGADDYLVKPFAAAELLARVRANVELARLRSRQARWRMALVDSLREAFFVCDEDGAVVEINRAFADALGFGPAGLPYRSPHPWWPDPETDAEAYQEVMQAFAALVGRAPSHRTIPVRHRDGHRVWINGTFNRVHDPDTGRPIMVGTFRDVTEEHESARREGARAALSNQLAQATSLADATATALAELERLWRADSVLAARFLSTEEPTLISTGSASSWSDLPERSRELLADLQRQPLLSAVSKDAGGGILLEHPHGLLAVWIDLGGNRRFKAEDRQLLALLAGQLSRGLVRIQQFDQQRETAMALQRAILGPSQLPAGFAVRYEPATPPLEVGGDWYDIVNLPDARIGIVVGDCVGRGLNAAAIMGQLRSACRALLLQEHSPARTLTALDHFAAGIPGAACTTVFCAVLDPATGEITYSAAGHPPGIIAGPDGSFELLEQAQGIALAVRPDWARPEAHTTMPARAVLLLYTDGLIERRGQSLDIGIKTACLMLQEGEGATPDALATQIMTNLAGDTGYDDDVALLLYRHPALLDLTVEARADQLAAVRATLRSWLHQCGVPVTTVQDILVAAGEACANAIEHGQRRASDGFFHLRAEAFPRELRIVITDAGRWIVPDEVANSHRGRGILLMRALTSQVTITSSEAGTRVEIVERIPR